MVVIQRHYWKGRLVEGVGLVHRSGGAGHPKEVRGCLKQMNRWGELEREPGIGAKNFNSI